MYVIANQEGRSQPASQPASQPKASSAQAGRNCWPLATKILFIPLALDPCQTNDARCFSPWGLFSILTLSVPGALLISGPSYYQLWSHLRLGCPLVRLLG